MASLSKNVASQNITFALITTAGAAATGKTVTVSITKDNGAQATGSGTVTEAGLGQYNYAPTQAETNATDVGFLFTATGCVPENLDFHTDQVDANGFLKVDLVDIAGSAVSTSSAQLGVNAVNIGASAVTLDANNLLEVCVTDIAGAAVSTTTAQLGVNAVKINNVAATSVTTINANQGTTQPVNFTGTAGSALVQVDVTDIATAAVATGTAQLGVNVVNIAGHAAAVDGNNLIKVDVEDIHGVALAAQALAQSTQSICWGTCSGGTTATAVVGTLNNPSSLTASGQLLGRTIIFLGNSSTGGVQAQASNITASTTGSTPTITFTAMTTAPANTDVFVIL